MRLIALLGLVVAALAAAPAPARPAGAAPGGPVPAFAARRLDGVAVRNVAPGGVTVLNFWATWCPPCRAETADLVTAFRRLHGPGVTFLGIDTTERAPIVRTFLSAKGVPYPTALAGPDVTTAFGIIGIPTTVVVDGNGIVRARWAGGVTPAQLAQYVAAARAGRTTTFISPAQARIDRMLAPERFPFADPARRAAAVRSANAAIAAAEHLADDDALRADAERTQHEAGRLRIVAGTAAHDPALIARGDADLGRWTDAIASYRAALARHPADPDVESALARALYRVHDGAGMVAADRRAAELRPHDGDRWADLGLAFQRTGQARAAVPVYAHALALLRAAAAATPTQAAIADVADTSLDFADVEVSLGDAAATARTFAQANAYADRLDPHGRYAELKRNVRERTQEGLIAVALAAPGRRAPVLSIAPWSGPDLPGSIASTLKYRLIVAARPNATVTLRALGLRREWIASFCADGLCSPQSVRFAAPPGGVKTYEFQLVPPVAGAAPGNVAIAAAGGPVVAVPR